MNQATKDRIAGVLNQHLGATLRAAYVFGSQASGESGPESDLDLAILVDAKPDPDLILAIKGDLSTALHLDVDLVDLVRANTVTRAQVIANGELLCAKDPVSIAHFETSCLAAYALLNEERREILDEILRTGNIYG